MFLFAAEIVFTNESISGLTSRGIANLTAETVLERGVTIPGQNFSPAEQTQLLVVYNNPLVHSWCVAVALTSISIDGALYRGLQLCRCVDSIYSRASCYVRVQP